jgi:hypothetical protein
MHSFSCACFSWAQSSPRYRLVLVARRIGSELSGRCLLGEQEFDVCLVSIVASLDTIILVILTLARMASI